MNRNDVIDVLTAVAAADRRTVGEADVVVWSGVIGDLSKDLALQAVVNHFRECPGVWLEPGHVRAGVKAIQRDRYERETRQQRAERELAIDAKVGQVVAELTEALPTIPPWEKYQRPEFNALSVRCPWCSAQPGDRCFTPGTRHPISRFHPSRVDVAKTSA